MQISLDILKEDIYEKVAEIEDENVLIAIKTLIENIHISKENSYTEKQDFNLYIKEWLKNMN